MSYHVQVDYSGYTPKAPQKEINGALRYAYDELGVEFFEVNLPRRFTVAGGIALNYQRRSRAYNDRKRRLFGHTRPLEFTGVTKARVLSLAYTRVKATATRSQGNVVLTLNAPTLNFRRSSSSPDLRDEITRIGGREVPPLERKLEKYIVAQFKAIQSNTTEKITG